MPALAYTDPPAAEADARAILATSLSEADLNHVLGQLGGGRAERGALACRVEEHGDYVVIVWKCRRCKRGQRAPLPKL